MPRVRKLQPTLGCSACILAAAVSMNGGPVRAEGLQPAVPASGIDLKFVDSAVRPQDDFYRHLNGKWLDSFEIPSDKSAYGAFNLIDDQTQQQLRSIVDGLEQNAADPDARKLADLYASFMDEARLESLRLKPLRADVRADRCAQKPQGHSRRSSRNSIEPASARRWISASIRTPRIRPDTPSSWCKAASACRTGTTI